MALRQIRGITGITPRENYNAIDRAKAETLPALKNYEFQKDATEKSLGLQEQSLANQNKYNKSNLKLAEEMSDAEAEDRKRAMWLQGGALGLSAANSLGGWSGIVDKAGKAADAVTGIFDSGDTASTVASTASDSSGLWDSVSNIGSGVADVVGDFGGAATGFLGDMASNIGNYASKAWDTITDVAGDAYDYVSDIFTF